MSSNRKKAWQGLSQKSDRIAAFFDILACQQSFKCLALNWCGPHHKQS